MSLKKHGKVMLNGVVVIAPVLITVYVVVAAILWLDGTVRQGLDAVLHRSFPGLGVVVGVGAIYLIGLLARSWLFGWAIGLGEGMVERIPLVKSLYSALRDMMQFLGGTEAESRGKPAVVQFEEGKLSLLGLITQEQTGGLVPGDGDRVAVYLPMSYQLGGYTVYVPRAAVKELEQMSVEDLLKLSLTAGVGAGKPEQQAQEAAPPTE